jgi:hypothetical protein
MTQQQVSSNGTSTNGPAGAKAEVKLPIISDEDYKAAKVALASLVGLFSADAYQDVETDKPRRLAKSWGEMGNGDKRVLLARAIALVNAKDDDSASAWMVPVRKEITRLGTIARLQAVQSYRVTAEMVAKLDETTRKALVSRMKDGEASLSAPKEAYVSWSSVAPLFPSDQVEETKVKHLHDMRNAFGEGTYKFAKGKPSEANGGKRLIIPMGEDFVKETLARDSDEVNEEIASLSAVQQ